MPCLAKAGDTAVEADDGAGFHFFGHAACALDGHFHVDECFAGEHGRWLLPHASGGAHQQAHPHLLHRIQQGHQTHNPVVIGAERFQRKVIQQECEGWGSHLQKMHPFVVEQRSLDSLPKIQLPVGCLAVTKGAVGQTAVFFPRHGLPPRKQVGGGFSGRHHHLRRVAQPHILAPKRNEVRRQLLPRQLLKLALVGSADHEQAKVRHLGQDGRVARHFHLVGEEDAHGGQNLGHKIGRVAAVEAVLLHIPRIKMSQLRPFAYRKQAEGAAVEGALVDGVLAAVVLGHDGRNVVGQAKLGA